MRVLVVEDEHKISRTLCQALWEESYAVDAAYDGEEAETASEVNEYDLIILDIMLPKKDGLRVCAEIRGRGSTTPILLLTAKDSYDDRVRGLDSGADDYLVKPFHMGELMARVRALLRRDSTTKSAVLRVDTLILDTSSHRVTRDGAPIDLTSKEYAILEYFMRNPDHVLTRTMISEHVWGDDFDSFSNIIDVYIRRLRRKIDDPSDTKLLHTVRGNGYMLSPTTGHEHGE